jgi:biotin operon repressor
MGDQSFKTKIQLAVWMDKSLSANQKCIMSYLIFRMNNETHKCWPSQITIAEDTDIGVKTTNKHIQALEKIGYLIRKMKFNKKIGQGWALTEYTIKFPSSEKGNVFIDKPFDKPNDFKNEGMVIEGKKVVEQIPTNYKENYKENYVNSLSKDAEYREKLEASKQAVNRRIQLENDIKAIVESKKMN